MQKLLLNYSKELMMTKKQTKQYLKELINYYYADYDILTDKQRVKLVIEINRLTTLTYKPKPILIESKINLSYEHFKDRLAELDRESS